MTAPAPAQDRYDAFVRSTTNVTPTDDGLRTIQMIRQRAQDLAHVIINCTSPSREQSLALTHLEETVMWAVKNVVLS